MLTIGSVTTSSFHTLCCLIVLLMSCLQVDNRLSDDVFISHACCLIVLLMPCLQVDNRLSDDVFISHACCLIVLSMSCLQVDNRLSDDVFISHACCLIVSLMSQSSSSSSDVVSTEVTIPLCVAKTVWLRPLLCVVKEHGKTWKHTTDMGSVVSDFRITTMKRPRDDDWDINNTMRQQACEMKASSLSRLSTCRQDINNTMRQQACEM
jgi:hypothetical protein